MSLYAQLSQPEFLLRSWRFVESRKGVSGVDGQDIEMFRRHRDRNILKLSEALKSERYSPSPLRGTKIPKDNGRFRRLGIPTIEDRVVFQGAHRLLSELWEPLFAPLSFAYRPGRSISDAVAAVAERIRSGKTWFVKGDIRGCFDTFNWDILSARLREWLPDEALRRLVNRALRVPIVEGGYIRRRCRGTPQGSPLSPLLANLYLHAFDLQMLRYGYPVIRYADDWLLLVGGEEEAKVAFQAAQASFSVLDVEMNREKSGIGDLRTESVDFLGHRIDAQKIDADSGGWRRFSEALKQLQNARDPSEQVEARAKLSHIRSMYRVAGAIFEAEVE